MRNKNFIRKLKGFKNLVLSLIIGLTLATGITFAWNAVWHGTDWIKSGGIIKAKEIAENFEYLFQKFPSKSTCSKKSIVVFNPNTSNLECLTCGSGSSVIFGNNGPECKKQARCRIKFEWYQYDGPYNCNKDIPSGKGEIYTNWTDFDRSDWVGYKQRIMQRIGRVSGIKGRMTLECKNAPSPMRLKYSVGIDQGKSNFGYTDYVTNGASIGPWVKACNASTYPNYVNGTFDVESKNGKRYCDIKYYACGDFCGAEKQNGEFAISKRAKNNNWSAYSIKFRCQNK